MGAQTLVVSYIPEISEGDSGGWLFVIENAGTFSRERMVTAVQRNLMTLDLLMRRGWLRHNTRIIISF